MARLSGLSSARKFQAHMALDGASEYSGHRTLRGVDHSPEL